MDPNETMRLLRQAVKNLDFDKAVEYAEYLVEWLEKGGFAPEPPTLTIPASWTRTWLRTAADVINHQIEKGTAE